MPTGRHVLILILFPFLVTHSFLATHSFTPEESAFLSWTLAHGASMHECLLWPWTFDTTGRGVLASCDIPENTVLVRVPHALLFGVEGSVRNKGGELVKRLAAERQKGTESFWKPYIDVLPKNLETVGDWVDEEMVELNDYDLAEEASHDKRMREETFLGFLQEDSKLNLTLLRWAWTVVNTRTFSVCPRGVAYCDEPYLVPLADLLNHGTISFTTWNWAGGVAASASLPGSVAAKQSFELFSPPYVLERGREVFNMYGPLPNRELLKTFGFAMEDNLFESIMVEFPISHTTFLELKRSVWDGSEIVLDRDTDPKFLLSFFRIAACEDEELLSTEKERYFSKPSSRAQERKALVTCVNIFNRHELFTHSSLEQDLERLKYCVPASRLYNAIAYRVARKKLLVAHALFCQRVLEEIVDCSHFDSKSARFMWYERKLIKIFKNIVWDRKL